MDIHDFIRRMSKPLYIFRMARGRMPMHVSPGIHKAAATRMENATKEIEDLVLAYADDIRKQRDAS